MLRSRLVNEHNLVESLEFEAKEGIRLSLASPLQWVIPDSGAEDWALGPGT
jgi:hypothetical protein